MINPYPYRSAFGFGPLVIREGHSVPRWQLRRMGASALINAWQSAISTRDAAAYRRVTSEIKRRQRRGMLGSHEDALARRAGTSYAEAIVSHDYSAPVVRPFGGVA